MPEIKNTYKDIETFENPVIPKFENTEYKKINSTIKEAVKEICLKNDLACNNDFILCLEYWKLSNQAKIKYTKDQLIVIFDKDKLMGLIKPESISRSRRELHKSGEILYSKETEEKRKKWEIEAKEYYHKYKDGWDEPINTPF